MTLAEYAELLGVNAITVRKWKQRGQIVQDSRGNWRRVNGPNPIIENDKFEMKGAVVSVVTPDPDFERLYGYISEMRKEIAALRDYIQKDLEIQVIELKRRVKKIERLAGDHGDGAL